MLLNEDLSVRTVVHAAGLEWVPSPTSGIDRRMLYRVGAEKARATSIVRYASHSRFPYHRHPGGEEILVLEGTFQDETGDFPAGSYIRNPPGTGHAPGSDKGCVIFVKLWQFRADDHERVVRLPEEASASVVTLFDNGYERVGLQEWQAGMPIEIENREGLELLVVSGSFSDEHENFRELSWLRLPGGRNLSATAGAQGARVWFKAGSLRQAKLCELPGTDSVQAG